MGICESKNTKQRPEKTAVNNLQINDVNLRDEDAEAIRKGALSSRDPQIAINSDVIISKSDVNPEVKYTKIRKLGAGGFGEVWLVRHKEIKKEFAMKIIKKQKNRVSEEKEIMNEVKILKTLDHPKVLKILDFYSTSDNFYIITDYCPNGELFKEIQNVGKFDEGSAAFIMNQVLKIVKYCHSMNIIHRDLKPENIMIESREKNRCIQIKIIDFGTAKIFEKGQPENRYVGSSYYIAPEVIQRKYTEKCDLWSCGVILYILLTGRAPFEGDDDDEIIQSVRKGKYDTCSAPFPLLSYEAKNLIKGLLEMDPKKRLSADEALNHNWFKSAKFLDKQKINDISLSQATDILNNIKTFKTKNMIRTLAVAFLVHHMTDSSECDETSKLFHQIDTNCDGKIQKEELIDGLIKYWKVSRSQATKDANEIFSNLDTDQNGYIEYEEFVRAAIDPDCLVQTNYMKFAFDYLDRDKSGQITIDEIVKRLAQNAKNAKDCSKIESEVKNMFKDIDTSGDGKISFNEFCKMMETLFSY